MDFDYEILIRFSLAALWGGIVGAEREYRGKSAGFRTIIMISIGACFFTIMSMQIGKAGNPDRIASNIVTGIGFLGAGVIFREENRIGGITTAATIWAVAAVGMGIGAGNYFASACASLLIFIVLAFLPYFENVIDYLNQTKVYTIHCPFSENMISRYEKLLKQYNLKFRIAKQIKEGDNLSITWQVQGHIKRHQRFINAVTKDDSIRKF